MAGRILSTTAREAVRNFAHYAAMVDSGAEVIITRRGRAPLKLVRAEPASTAKNREALVNRALAIRSAKPFIGKFVRGATYGE